MQVENTVFISYRRKLSPYHAMAVYEHLTANGYDVFVDHERLDAGSFERVILKEIRQRAHFVVILNPDSLERCLEPKDWLRREIETAMKYKRNIIPLMFDGFNFEAAQDHIVGPLHLFKGYQGIEIPNVTHFIDRMGRLRSNYLARSLDSIVHPNPDPDPDLKTRLEDLYESATKKWQNKNYEVALLECERALWLDGNYAPAYMRRGTILQAKGDLDAAISDYDEALRLKPDDAMAYHNRGFARQAQGDLDAAIRDYDEALRLKPDDAKAYYNRGNARQDQGDLDAAIQDYTRSIDYNNPELHLPYNNRGLARQAKGDLDAAISDYDEALRLKPDDATAYYNRGNARQDQGDLDAAIRDYDEALRLKPDYAKAYFNRGRARYKQGDFQAAIRDYERVLKIDPNHQLARKNLEIARRKLKDSR